MLWKKPASAPKDQPAPPTPPSTIEQDLASALRAYADKYKQEIDQGPDEAVERARETVQRAEKLLVDSGVVFAFEDLIDAVKHWPSWLTKPNYDPTGRLPVTNAAGAYSKEDDGRTTVATVGFRYKDREYIVVIRDPGFGDLAGFGHAELWKDDTLRLSINMNRNPSDEIQRWHWVGVTGLSVGDWMKDILEMSAHIRANEDRSLKSLWDKDLVSNANNIKF